MNTTNEMQLYRLIYYPYSALHVSDVVFAHQEHLTVFTASGSILPSCCRLVTWMRWNSSTTPAGNDIGVCYQMLEIQLSAPDDGRKHRPKHVELTRNNRLTCIVCILLVVRVFITNAKRNSFDASIFAPAQCGVQSKSANTGLLMHLYHHRSLFLLPTYTC